jgi:hypothetical protein
VYVQQWDEKIVHVVEQLQAEMAGSPSDEIFAAMQERLHHAVPAVVRQNPVVVAKLRDNAQRISDGGQTPGASAYLLDQAGEPILDQAGNPMS